MVATQAVRAIPNVDTLPERQLITLSYRAWQFDQKVSCMEQYVDICDMAAIKSHGVDAGIVTPFGPEVELTPIDTSTVYSIDNELLKPINAVRERANLIMQQCAQTGEAMHVPTQI